MKLLLTGATGFVGRNFLLRVLAERTYEEILVPVRSIEKLRAQFLGDGYEGIPSPVKPIVTSAPNWGLKNVMVDHVVHSAGVIIARSRGEYFRTNVDGTLELLRCIGNPSKIIILSSQAAAGPCRGMEEKRESDSEEPLTWYGQSKLEMEKRVAAEFSHLKYLFLRPPIILGPRDQMTLPLFKMVRSPVHFKPGLRSKFYSYVSVYDLINAILAVLRSEKDWSLFAQRHFFVASEEPTSDRELIASAARVSNKWGFLIHVPQPLIKVVSRVIDAVPTWRASIPSLSADRAKEIWPNRWVVSSDAFSSLFGWKPMESLWVALKATHEWYVKTGQLPA
jgi:nucleoside-diphosphate-sugar epimerase